MKEFKYYLDKIGEIGFVEQTLHSIVYVSGLPGAHPGEFVVFENGETGQVFSVNENYIEILLFSAKKIKVGSQVARCGEGLTVPVGIGLLGRVINPLGVPLDGISPNLTNISLSPIDREPLKIIDRKDVDKPLETGTNFVDFVIPLSRGQRELIIGDRKTGKTEFLRTAILAQARMGVICIYSVIGQKRSDILALKNFSRQLSVVKNTIVVASSSSDAAGLIYLTPLTAMTIAENFRDQGHHVLLILDDMTTHARVYREISLLARRFPGRSSYPGDIFYLHAKLMERAGYFKKGSISLFPVAESVLGDISGYIQTNLMSMTDGHIFFDIDLYNEGKRPAVNPFLSVTRIGHQTQAPLFRDASRELSSFLVTYERMKQFLHFGAEVGQTAKNILNLGQKLDTFFNHNLTNLMPASINMSILAGLFAGLWSEKKTDILRHDIETLILNYRTDDVFRNKLEDLITSQNSFSELVSFMRREGEILTDKLS